ncbi:hypothetical protein CPLU01_07920 [Colletotrichum plurivorum]|uniref:Uncharacterized protein n=1 Tax=Colletotrichum plurivorum TaxID=2175906 RepID=A0A8H6KDL5_9PEZI|nr:hypothetical protein CPLU01_07920 [Colletotrichum plurivorum]
MDEESHIATVGPRSFLFFVVADVGPPGPGGRHRPLAVTYRQGRGHGPSRSMNAACRRIRQVVQDVARALDIFSSPANRTAIEAERTLAAAEYLRPGRPEPPRVEVPGLPQPSLADDMFHGKPQDVEQPGERPPSSPPRVDEWVREYPFISSCLRLALIRADDEEEDGAAGMDDVQERPLATIFRDDALEYGAVVIDVSDLDDVRYGIVGSKIHYVAATGAGFAGTMGWDFTESYYHGPPPRLFLDNSGLRTPLSGAAYVDKFRVGRRKGRLEEWPALQRLERHHVVDRRTLGYIWPPALQTSSEENSNPIHDVIDDDATVQKFISDVLSSETFDIQAHGDTLRLPSFQDRLRTCLLRDPERLRSSEASTQLLRLAYASCRHLDWTTYRNLSFEHIATTLLDPAHFDNVRALSICVDEIDGSSAPLLEAVQQREMMRDICFLEGPSRTSDGKSLDIFLQVCASPFASDLLGSRNFFITCAFSAPLQRRAWLQDPATGTRVDSPALRKAFPVQHMFVRQQFVPHEEVEPQDIMDYDQEEEEEKEREREREREERGEVEEGEEEPDAVFRPCHFYAGDALLKPKRFVSGFLQYCRWILDDRHLVSFAATPSSPSLPRSMDTQVGPIPAENLAGGTPFGSLEPGEWVVVVSHEWRTTQHIRKDQRLHMSWGYPSDWLIGVPVVRYAFLRARQRIVLPDGAGPELEQLAGPDSVDVAGGVKEFLQDTGVDWKLVDERLEETNRLLRERWRPGEGPAKDLPADMKLLDVFEEAEARIVFKDFLADAAGVRTDVIFRSLEERDTAGGARPLGSQRRLEPPEIHLSGYRPRSDEGTSWLYGPPTMM